MSFQMRTSCPGNYDKNYMRTSSGGWNTCIQGYPCKKDADVLSNCVGYASGRFNEIINIARGTTGCTYKYLNCNAENFVERAKSAGLATGSTPRRGAIMCWQKGSLSSSDGAGHVAIVERVDSNNQVYTSESGYGGSHFWNSVRTNNNGRWGIGSGYSFRCFIYLPSDVQKIIDDSPSPTPPGPSSKFNIGDKVIANGPLYASSTASSPAGSVSNKETVVTRKVVGAAHPYNTTGDLGWMDESSLTAVSPTPPTPTPPAPTPCDKFNIGDSVVLNGPIYVSSNASSPANTIKDKHTKITRKAAGTAHPYNTTGDLGWCDEASLTKDETPSEELKAGDKVKITGYGKSSSYGDNPVAGGIGWTRYILKVWDGRPYPYQVGNNSGTTGFYKKDSLKKL